MQTKDINKEIVRFVFTILSVFTFTLFIFSTNFINEENTNIFVKNLIQDFNRFLSLNLSVNYSIEIIVLIYSISLVSFISASYWYNNPHLYVENQFQVYFKIFSLTSLFIVFFFFIF